MSMQRMTISVPKTLYDDLVYQLPQGKISQFAAQAIEKELFKINASPMEEFIALRKILPKKKKTKILVAIKKGRQ